jgi:hypothetical protein
MNRRLQAYKGRLECHPGMGGGNRTTNRDCAWV